MLNIGRSVTGDPKANLRQPGVDEDPKIVGLGKNKNINFTALFSLLALLLFILMAVFLFIYKLNRSAVLDQKTQAFTDLNTQLKAKDMKEIDQQAQRLDSGLKASSQFLTQRSLFSVLIAELKKITPSEVKLTNLAVDENLVAKVTGQADNYESVAKLLVLLKNSEKFSKPQLASVTQGSSQESQNSVNFSLTTQIIANKLKTTSKELDSNK